ncbi:MULTISPECIES: hypothetical protein [Rhodopseudomonas]|uniref:hypothetical protein n=1 Tax=Rhodopseudomonas TaxID=1073 RepID=UPI001F41E085|nr:MULTISPECIES: hypothetical protein [Rhodopseudomonas]MDF3811748.1 hypothetical protein [Rhodopseudomonas sp. BAL398]WOK20876.1 hypothetical protein RBJ75_24070 [Rhodopseudomonas sp. BAL398]
MLMACGVSAAMIAYLVLDDLWHRVFPRQPRPEPAPSVAEKPANPRRSGWFAWTAS